MSSHVPPSTGSEGLYYAISGEAPRGASPHGTQPQSAAAAQPVIHIINSPPQRSGSWGGWFLSGCFSLIGTLFITFVAIFGGLFLMLACFGAMIAMISGDVELEFGSATGKSKLPAKFVKGERSADAKIAIMRIDGVIMQEDDGFVAKQIAAIEADETIRGVVLRIDSPGGTIAGSDYYLYKLRQMKASRKIPIVVSMGSVAASGGYYVAMVGDTIMAEPSTITGSIGVVVPLFSAVELAKKIGVESTPIVSGPLKSMGSVLRPMSDEERAVWTHLVDESFARFKQIIRDGRQNFADDPAALDTIADGRIYTATEACTNGLIDSVGYLDDAIDECLRRANLSLDAARVIQFKKGFAFSTLLEESRLGARGISAETITDLTTPRLYYLCPQVIPVR